MIDGRVAFFTSDICHAQKGARSVNKAMKRLEMNTPRILALYKAITQGLDVRRIIGVYRRGRMPQIASTWETDMGQNDSIDDQKPKKKLASHILYYVIYIAILVVIGAVVFIFF